VSCLIDNKEWHEGIVVEFRQNTGKHQLEFRSFPERKWMTMSKVAFYILEHREGGMMSSPPIGGTSNNGEYKENDSERESSNMNHEDSDVRFVIL
jgi:hypothetical protein